MHSKSCYTVSLLLMILIGLIGCDNRQSSDRFRRGRELLMNGQFDAAERELAEFEKQNPGHALSSRAKFLRAKAKMGAGDYRQARQLFQETIDQFPKSEESDKAHYKLALIELLEDNAPEAERRLQEIIDRSGSIYFAEAKAMREMLERQRAE